MRVFGSSTARGCVAAAFLGHSCAAFVCHFMCWFHVWRGRMDLVHGSLADVHHVGGTLAPRRDPVRPSLWDTMARVGSRRHPRSWVIRFGGKGVQTSAQVCRPPGPCPVKHPRRGNCATRSGATTGVTSGRLGAEVAVAAILGPTRPDHAEDREAWQRPLSCVPRRQSGDQNGVDRTGSAPQPGSSLPAPVAPCPLTLPSSFCFPPFFSAP